MRKFWLENETGERLSLQSDSLFFYTPAGLGFAEERDYQSTESGFFEIADEQAAQPELSGTFVFRKEPYKRFREVTDWIVRAERLRLIYCPHGTQEYCMDVCVDLLEKGEIQIGVLEVPVQMHGLTPWYTSNSMVFLSTDTPGENVKRYDFRYPYRYSLTSIPGKIPFRISGHFRGGVRLIAKGPLTAPVFDIKNTDTDELYGKLDLSSISINSGETLEFSSLVNNEGVWKRDENGRTDLMDAVELYAGVPLFMRIPVNTPLTATLTAESLGKSGFTMYIHEYWKTR